MESGSLLHLALLRKTSNARHKKKTLKSKKMQAQENYILSGWSIEDVDFKQDIEKQKKYQTPQQQTEYTYQALSYRRQPKTSERQNSNRYKSFTFRGSTPKRISDFTLHGPKMIENVKMVKKPKYSKIDINYREKTEGTLKENNTMLPLALKPQKNKPVISFTKFVSDISLRNKRNFRKF